MPVRFVLVVLLMIGCLITTMPAIAQATFKAGDRVFVTSLKEWGTVTEVSPNGRMVSVILDRLHTTNPSAAIMFDRQNVEFRQGAPAAPGQPAVPANPGHPTATVPGKGDVATPVARNAPASKALFMQLIRNQFISIFSDRKVTVKFLTFDVAGSRPYDPAYAQGYTYTHGHTTPGYPVHSRLTVLVSNDNPNDVDRLYRPEGDWMCYKSETGEWVAAILQKNPNWEHAEVIPKH